MIDDSGVVTTGIFLGLSLGVERSELSQLRDGTDGTPRNGDHRPGEEDECPKQGAVSALDRVGGGADPLGEVGAD